MFGVYDLMIFIKLSNTQLREILVGLASIEISNAGLVKNKIVTRLDFLFIFM